MLLLIAVAFLLKHYGTQAIPLPTPSPTSASFEAPIFSRDNPSDGCDSRTVLDILWSCLATTFACTWVSVHPNVPFKGEGKWTLLRRRIFLMFFSILAPEFMIMWAFKQWRGAVMIREAVNDAFPGSDRPWTTTHGHLLQMGGFRLQSTAIENFRLKGSNDCMFRRAEFLAALSPNTSLAADRSAILELNATENKLFNALSSNDVDRLYSIHQRTRNLIHPDVHYRHETQAGSWTNKLSLEDSEHLDSSDLIWEGVLSSTALKHLLTENLIHLPTITEDEINDRSKGDALSKGIALLQLTWFIVQIITRAVQGSAITELELTTAALAGLNSVMYIFWWSKPRDVRFPVVIRTKGVEELRAKRTKDVSCIFSNQEFDFRKYLWTSFIISIEGMINSIGASIVSFAARAVHAFAESLGAVRFLSYYFYSQFSNVWQLFSRQFGEIKGHKYARATNEEGNGSPRVIGRNSPRDASSHRSCMEKLWSALIHCTTIAANCFMFLGSLLTFVINFGVLVPISQILNKDPNDKWLPTVFNTDELTGVFFMIFYSEDADLKQLLSTSSIAGALFGAVHCLAWHFSFPSHAEQILWRTASLGIVGSCVVTFQSVLCWDFTGDMESFWELVAGHLMLLGFILCGLASFIYPVARITLLVLAITSLRSLPSSAFDTVDWIDFVPHI